MRLDWWLLGICSARALTQTVTMTYAAAMPVLQKEWEMSAALAGGISSGFQIGYAISLFVFSLLADRAGARRLYLLSLSGSALFSLAFALLARSAISGLVLYTMVGISLGGTYTTGLIILAQEYPPERRGMATGLFIASSSLGYVLSLALSGLAIPTGGYTLSFLLTCLGPGFGAAISWIILGRAADPPPPYRAQETFRKTVLANRPARLLIGAYTFHSWELLGMWTWAPAFVAACLMSAGIPAHGAAGHGASVTAGFHMAGIAASFGMGALSDKMGRARVILLASLVSSICSFLFGWSISWPFFLVMGIGIIYAFSALGDSPVLSAAITEVVNPSHLGATFGLRSLLGFGAGAVSPVVFGLVLDMTNPLRSVEAYYSTWGWAFSVFGVGGLGAVWCAHRLHLAQRKDASL